MNENEVLDLLADLLLCTDTKDESVNHHQLVTNIRTRLEQNTKNEINRSWDKRNERLWCGCTIIDGKRTRCSDCERAFSLTINTNTGVDNTSTNF